MDTATFPPRGVKAIGPDLLRNGMDSKPKRKLTRDRNTIKDFESYFKIGVSDEYILIRRDFPMRDISPCDFTRLLTEMFRRNHEALYGK
jgi:hypothetical protein